MRDVDEKPGTLAHRIAQRLGSRTYVCGRLYPYRVEDIVVDQHGSAGGTRSPDTNTVRIRS
ncbi:hypothetical protein NHF48_010895 [Sphingomonas sp. H160509]|uniref:hypothetical protein n=1 Tax=Sphingomonas sp. H160509 TaxID=2955313 RepID=UPI0020981E50|nr:hypothetical protein [Sphingomonas sp. H160509]MDD1451361.1 hypothetical protein [Sphingomonas sp. H160509]